MIIEIICPLGAEGNDYAEYMRLTGEALKSGNHELRWNSISEKDIKTPHGFKDMGKVECVIPKRGVGIQVGTCYNEGVKRIKGSDADFVFLIDADVALLEKNWDDTSLKVLDKYDTFGINRSNKNCLAATGKELFWYRNFPIPAFMIFSMKMCRELNWNFLPDKKKDNIKIHSHIADKKDSKICGVPVGTMLKRDGGWKIPYIFAEKGYSNPLIMEEVFRTYKNSISHRSKKERKYCDRECTPWHMVEYHLKGVPFCTHLAGSRHTPFLSKISKIWRDRIERHVKNKHNIDIT